MKALLATFLLLTIALPTSGWAWGANGHRVVGEIAEARLSPAASAAVRRIAGPRPLAMLGTWSDYVRAEDDWSFASRWHYVTVRVGQPVDEAVALGPLIGPQGEVARPGNVVESIAYLTAVLDGDSAVRDDFAELLQTEGAGLYAGSLELTALAFLSHMVGDVHQPMHVGQGGDRGGNQISVNFFDEITNLHSVWDTGLIEHQGLSYTELAAFIEAETVPGLPGAAELDPRAWARQSFSLRPRVYEIWDRTSRDNRLPELSWDYSHDYVPVVRRQLALAGMRLAGLLNRIFE